MEELERQLERMMQQVAVTSAVSDIARSYDAFAIAALEALLQQPATYLSFEPPKIAELAWSMADAMMAERRKRGLGGIKSPTETAP